MSDNKKTIWQKLGDVISPNKTPIITQKSTYSIDSKELLKTSSIEDYKTEKLQAQQNLYLKNQWARVDNTLYQQAVYYETSRIAAYTDFEAMEFYPEISAALDIFMEESTTLDGNGVMLQIYSESDRVKRVLNDLFYNRLDITTSLPMWVRNTAKYGDNFVYLDLEDKKGVVNCKQLPNIEIERHESEVYNAINGVVNTDSINSEENRTKFLWKHRNFKFNPWQIAHFRLLGDDRRIPYGTSILEKCRRIYKQLLLAEDAMLIYRITRAPERRIFKVFVGNMDDKDIEPYVNQIANKFKRTPVVDPKTGQIDVKYNMMPVWKDTPIPLLDGRTITIENLSKELKENKNIEVYSIQDNTHKIVPGKVVWCDKNYTSDTMVKVILDDDTYILTAPEHPFILRDGTKKNASDLLSGDILIPYHNENEIKVKSIEYVKGDDVYCMTVVGPNGEDDRHNFALKSFNKDGSVSNSGVFVSNSSDQDYFIPVRDVSAPSPIDTLPGASNLAEIADIQYLQKKLFAALRVPKPFLGFEEAVGEGKNLALQDIRFTRTINRLQQAILQELNKIAIIHLYLVGLEEELDNFTLSLNNPSTQAEMLKIEHLQQKVELYKSSVSDAGNGFGAMSMTRAKKEILNMSNDQIKLDLEQQRLEKAAAAELANTANVIKKTGIFDSVDKIYGDTMGGDVTTTSAPTETPSEPSMGGFDTGSSPEITPTEPTTPSPAEGEPTTGEESVTTGESVTDKLDKLLIERKDLKKREYINKVQKHQKTYFNHLMESLEKDDRITTLNESISPIESDYYSKITKEIDDIIKD